MTDILPHAQPTALDCASGAAPAGDENVFVMPCSAAQVRFWQIDQLSGKQGAVFNIQLALHLAGPLREDILRKSLDALVERHEILRTSFKQIDGEVKQIISSHALLTMGTLDLGAVPDNERPERLTREIQLEADRPLPLGEKPIFRPMLIRLTPEEHVLLLTLHHIVCDGWATGILVREFSAFYRAFFHGKPPDLPPLAVQYADYALWQGEWIKTPEHARQLAYWKEQLSRDIPILDFPTDYPRRSGQAFPSTIETLLLPRELSDAVQRLSREWDITPYLLLFTTYILLLHRYSGQNRFIVGTVVANRPRVELEDVMGAFANPMILRADLSGEPTVRALLNTTREMVLGSFDHQEIPFEHILQELESGGGANHKPTIQTFFFFQKAFLQPAEFGGVTMKPIRSVTPGTTFEQTLAIIERAEGMRLQIDYNTDLFTQESMERFLLGFQILLQGIIAQPDARISELPMLSAEERAALEKLCDSVRGKGSRRNPREVLEDLDLRFKQRRSHDGPDSRAALDAGAYTKYLVLDESLRAVPPGVPGNVYVAGIEPSGESSHEYTWVKGPADFESTIPLLKTEYRGRGLPDGKIELWGKASEFVSFRGFRINLHGIEAHLLSHPRVADAAAVKDEATGKLVCYVALKGAALKDESDLRAFLRDKVSDLVPLAPIVLVPAIPRDETGKLLLERLRGPKIEAEEDDSDPGLILHQQLEEIWKDILKVSEVSPEDNFFDLGGSSFQAVRMMAQIEKVFGESLPLSLLLQGATVSNLARAISGRRQDEGSMIQVVQAKGTRAPLFFLHGDWAGGGFYCNRIARLIGEDQPFYAVPPYRNSEDKVVSMDEMAAFHVKAIKQLVPKGPYLLGGYCIGATLAVEIARQLMEQGDVVAHIFLVDPSLKRVAWLRHVWTLVNAAGKALDWNLKKRMAFHDRYPVALDRWLKLPIPEKITTFKHRFTTSKAARDAAAATPVDILNTVEYGVYVLANRLYVSRALSVPATFYYPLPPALARAHAKFSRLDPTRIDVQELPGNHVTCITTHASVLGDKLKAKLAGLRV